MKIADDGRDSHHLNPLLAKCTMKPYEILNRITDIGNSYLYKLLVIVYHIKDGSHKCLPNFVGNGRLEVTGR